MCFGPCTCTATQFLMTEQELTYHDAILVHCIKRKKKQARISTAEISRSFFEQFPPYVRKQEVYKSVTAASAVREVHSPLNSLMKGLSSQAASLIRLG